MPSQRKSLARSLSPFCQATAASATAAPLESVYDFEGPLIDASIREALMDAFCF